MRVSCGERRGRRKENGKEERNGKEEGRSKGEGGQRDFIHVINIHVAW